MHHKQIRQCNSIRGLKSALILCLKINDMLTLQIDLIPEKCSKKISLRTLEFMCKPNSMTV